MQGWESRLAALVESVRARPYALGEHDCFRFACGAVEAMTGEDRWPEFAGRYSTKREALVLLATYGRTFEDAFTWFFRTQPVKPALARRGDVLAFEEDGEKHLGVCLGARTAGLGEDGLLFVRTLACTCAWRIG
jgi:hypothetical protein